MSIDHAASWASTSRWRRTRPTWTRAWVGMSGQRGYLQGRKPTSMTPGQLFYHRPGPAMDARSWPDHSAHGLPAASKVRWRARAASTVTVGEGIENQRTQRWSKIFDLCSLLLGGQHAATTGGKRLARARRRPDLASILGKCWANQTIGQVSAAQGHLDLRSPRSTKARIRCSGSSWQGSCSTARSAIFLQVEAMIGS